MVQIGKNLVESKSIHRRTDIHWSRSTHRLTLRRDIELAVPNLRII